jgi:hypothetical protein
VTHPNGAVSPEGESVRVDARSASDGLTEGRFGSAQIVIGDLPNAAPLCDSLRAMRQSRAKHNV